MRDLGKLIDALHTDVVLGIPFTLNGKHLGDFESKANFMYLIKKFPYMHVELSRVGYGEYLTVDTMDLSLKDTRKLTRLMKRIRKKCLWKEKAEELKAEALDEYLKLTFGVNHDKAKALFDTDPCFMGKIKTKNCWFEIDEEVKAQMESRIKEGGNI